MLYRMPNVSFCAIRRLVSYLWYNLEKNITCTEKVRILQITLGLMF